MMAAALSDERVRAGLRAAFLGSIPNAVLIPEAIDAGAALVLREAVTARLAAVTLADRGRYATGAASALHPLVEEIRALVASIASAELEVIEARWLHYRSGGYALYKDGPALGEAAVEATLDLSLREVAGGEIVYGQCAETLVALPSAPLSLAIVGRPPLSVRQTRYLPLLQGEVELLRLRVLLVGR